MENWKKYYKFEWGHIYTVDRYCVGDFYIHCSRFNERMGRKLVNIVREALASELQTVVVIGDRPVSESERGRFYTSSNMMKITDPHIGYYRENESNLLKWGDFWDTIPVFRYMHNGFSPDIFSVYEKVLMSSLEFGATLKPENDFASDINRGVRIAITRKDPLLIENSNNLLSGYLENVLYKDRQLILLSFPVTSEIKIFEKFVKRLFREGGPRLSASPNTTIREISFYVPKIATQIYIPGMTFSQFENEFQRALEELYREYYPRALSLAERISSDPVEISKNIIHHFEPRDGIEKSIKLFRKFVWMLTGTLLDLEPDLAELTEEQKEKWK